MYVFSQLKNKGIKMKEKISNAFKTFWYYTKATLIAFGISLALLYFVAPNSVLKLIPSFSWWSTTLFSDNYTKSIITEVEASGHNIRKVQSIDAFGRVCTDTFSNAGTSTDCDYPPASKSDWSIEDYKKLLKK